MLDVVWKMNISELCLVAYLRCHFPLPPPIQVLFHPCLYCLIPWPESPTPKIEFSPATDSLPTTSLPLSTINRANRFSSPTQNVFQKICVQWFVCLSVCVSTTDDLNPSVCTCVYVCVSSSRVRSCNWSYYCRRLCSLGWCPPGWPRRQLRNLWCWWCRRNGISPVVRSLLRQSLGVSGPKKEHIRQILLLTPIHKLRWKECVIQYEIHLYTVYTFLLEP